MLLSELIIIYLAAAAPFGVAEFLHRPADVSSPRSLLQAAGTALLWPLILLSRPLVQKQPGLRKLHAPGQNPSVLRESRIDDAQRALLSVLYRIEDLARESSSSNTEAARESVCEVIAAVECYVGLSLAVADADVKAAPRETELCRIAGREEVDDLFVAGRCHQRRNLARLNSHQAESRLELLHALAELREVCERTQAATTKQDAASQLFATLLDAYARVIDLLSLFEDQDAALRVARLLDAACARLGQRSETPGTQVAPQSLVHQNMTGDIALRDEPCTTSIPHTTTTQPRLSPPQQTTLRAHG